MKQFDYDTAMSHVMTSRGAFFAFSKHQLEEARVPGVEYISLGHGLVSPKDQAENLMSDFQKIHDAKIAWELANNTKKEIIWYELANHECQISGSYHAVIDLLKPYGITKDDIKAEWPAYYNHCVEHDYF